jgi:hypothetical protein
MDQWLKGWLREKCLLPFKYGKQIMVTNNPMYVFIVAIQKCMKKKWMFLLLQYKNVWKKDSFRHWFRIGTCFVHNWYWWFYCRLL